MPNYQTSLWELLTNSLETPQEQCLFQLSFAATKARAESLDKQKLRHLNKSSSDQGPSASRNVGSALFHYHDKISNKHFYEVTGRPSVSMKHGDITGHSERASLQAAVSNAIKNNMLPFAALPPGEKEICQGKETQKPARESFQELLHQDSPKPAALWDALKQLNTMMVFTERPPCPASNGCEKFFSTLSEKSVKNGGQSIDVYYAFPDELKEEQYQELIEVEKDILATGDFVDVLEEKGKLLKKLQGEKIDSSEREAIYSGVAKINLTLLTHVKDKLAEKKGDLKLTLACRNHLKKESQAIEEKIAHLNNPKLSSSSSSTSSVTTTTTTTTTPSSSSSSSSLLSSSPSNTSPTLNDKNPSSTSKGFTSLVSKKPPAISSSSSSGSLDKTSVSALSSSPSKAILPAYKVKAGLSRKQSDFKPPLKRESPTSTNSTPTTTPTVTPTTTTTTTTTNADTPTTSHKKSRHK